MPTCKEDGSFDEIQCHDSTGECWCVDNDGNELPDTKVAFGTPDCTKSKLCFRI